MSILVAIAAAAFVLFTSQSLPTLVASHFDGSGVANGFMPRQFYAWFMLALTAGLPLLLTLLPSLLFRSERIRLNLPNRDYWLAPERKSATVAYLCRHNARFATALTLFLCYVHWLVLRANATAPPRLSSPQFISGLLAFGAFAVAWFAMLLGRFRKVPRESA